MKIQMKYKSFKQIDYSEWLTNDVSQDIDPDMTLKELKEKYFPDRDNEIHIKIKITKD